MEKEYDEIIARFKELESSMTSLVSISQEFNFVSEDKISQDNILDCNEYEVFKSNKEDKNYRMTIIISTKDNYKTCGNDDEPYRNVLELWKDGILERSNEYIYFK